MIRGWWGPGFLTVAAHGVLLAVVLPMPDPPQLEEPRVVLRVKAPPPEQAIAPPPPEPPPPEPEPPPPPPEPAPPALQTPAPPEPKRTPKPEPAPSQPQPQPQPQPEPPPEPPPTPAVDPLPPATDASPAKLPTRPATKPSKPSGGTVDLGAYAKSMRSKLLRHRRYPPAALRTGLEGVVKVKIAVDRRGRIVGEPVVVQSSGHPVLDAEALRIARVAAPYDPFPDDVDKDVHKIVIPIDFHIER